MKEKFIETEVKVPFKDEWVERKVSSATAVVPKYFIKQLLDQKTEK